MGVCGYNPSYIDGGDSPLAKGHDPSLNPSYIDGGGIRLFAAGKCEGLHSPEAFAEGKAPSHSW